MGFDDIVWDNEIKEKTIATLRPLIGQYDYENWDELVEMEIGEMGYNAYSLIYRQIHAINYAVMCGHCPHAPSTEAIERCHLGSREEVLKLFLEEVDKDHSCVIKGNNLKKMGGKIREIHEETMCLLKNQENKELKDILSKVRKDNEKLKEELQKSKNHRDHRLHNKMEKEIEKLKEQNHSYIQVSKSLKEENEKWQEWIRQVLMMGHVGSNLIEAMMEEGFLEDQKGLGGPCIPILTNIK
jgi:predicted RNase H-like nuclease (RuvC/YqgF family)